MREFIEIKLPRLIHKHIANGVETIIIHKHHRDIIIRIIPSNEELPEDQAMTLDFSKVKASR